MYDQDSDEITHFNKPDGKRHGLIVGAEYIEPDAASLYGFSISLHIGRLPPGNFEEALRGEWDALQDILNKLSEDYDILIRSSVHDLIMDAKNAGLISEDFRL